MNLPNPYPYFSSSRFRLKDEWVKFKDPKARLSIVLQVSSGLPLQVTSRRPPLIFINPQRNASVNS